MDIHTSVVSIVTDKPYFTFSSNDFSLDNLVIIPKHYIKMVIISFLLVFYWGHNNIVYNVLLYSLNPTFSTIFKFLFAHLITLINCDLNLRDTLKNVQDFIHLKIDF